MNPKLEQIKKLADEAAAEFATQTARFEQMLSVGKIRSDFRPLRFCGVSYQVKKPDSYYVANRDIVDRFCVLFHARATGDSGFGPNIFENICATFDLSDKGRVDLKLHLDSVSEMDKVDTIFNKEIVAHNVKIKDSVMSFIEKCGIPSREYKDVSGPRSSKRKMEWVNAEWYTNLPGLCKISFPDCPRYSVEQLLRAFDEAFTIRKQALAKAEQEKEAAILANPKTPLAIEFLSKRGKTLGTDFTVLNAIEIANNIRFDELVAEHKGGMISFGGDDDCTNCKGWDGESPRCDCGGRRVGWESSGDFTNMSIWAQAD